MISRTDRICCIPNADLHHAAITLAAHVLKEIGCPVSSFYILHHASVILGALLSRGHGMPLDRYYSDFEPSSKDWCEAIDLIQGALDADRYSNIITSLDEIKVKFNAVIN